MLGIVLAWEVPLARVGVVSVPSCFTGLGDGVLEPIACVRALASCVNGEGAMSRGSILDSGGGDDGRRACGCIGAGGAGGCCCGGGG